MRNSNCPRCQGSMAEGYTVDVGHYGERSISSWIEGAPEKGVFGLKLGKKRKIEIQTWRCGRCGYLESYARD